MEELKEDALSAHCAPPSFQCTASFSAGPTLGLSIVPLLTVVLGMYILIIRAGTRGQRVCTNQETHMRMHINTVL